ncbi:Hypothetical protein, putative [Bodo saltans]|uniref:Uncharacterized protein n=1 Tax=Bodo saltans TaxID=75058 RepID=A0A0S4JHG0_BODSA|nr:Hypothetical protein, putative [Bodo saltans]|eukprot:CUG90924.1 Hypothetical protein, putative [Bodo saltans]
MQSGARPQTAGPRIGSGRRDSALELARYARQAWQQGKEVAARASFETTGDYCRSEKFFDASQRIASHSRFMGHHRRHETDDDDTAATLQLASTKRPTSAAAHKRTSYDEERGAIIDASILSSVPLPRSGASSFFSSSHLDSGHSTLRAHHHDDSPSVPSLAATSPPQPQIHNDDLLVVSPISSADALRRAELEHTARSNILETLTMADSSGPPLKQTIGLSSFAQLLRDHHHQTRALDNPAVDHKAAEEQPLQQQQQPGRMFHQRPSTAQPRPTKASPPPLNCFRPWSSMPLRPYQDPLQLLKSSAQVQHGSSNTAATRQTSLGYGSAVSSSSKVTGSTLSRATQSKSKDPLSILLQQQAADVTKRADLRVSYQANMDALRLRQENLENVLCRIADARRL